MERIDKLLSATGRWTRREAKDLCRAGRVAVDGIVVTNCQTKVLPTACLTVDGSTVDTDRFIWLMLHKPAGLVCATQDPRQPTVLSLLPEHYRCMGLFPVGRLDKDTEGLLLLTNDGALAHDLLSPKNHVDKVYYVEVDGMLVPGDITALSAGLTLADGLQCLPAQLRILDGGRGEITLHEGKYHQVKRMLAARGKLVTYLRRTAFGPLKLDESLKPGQWRPLTTAEQAALAAYKKSAG